MIKDSPDFSENLEHLIRPEVLIRVNSMSSNKARKPARPSIEDSREADVEQDSLVKKLRKNLNEGHSDRNRDYINFSSYSSNFSKASSASTYRRPR